MKFFLDTANTDEIREALTLGVVDGVTTNPSLVAKEGRDFHEVLREIAGMVNGPISAEVTAEDHKTMMEQAHVLTKIHSNIVIKVPLTKAGLQSCKKLREEGTDVNVTLCFSPVQALLAAKANATYISPFLGRLDDVGHDGMELIQQIRVIYDNYGYETQILAASIRHTLHMVQCAMAGADVATMPYKVIQQLIKHPLTDSGLAQFNADWQKMTAKS